MAANASGDLELFTIDNGKIWHRRLQNTGVSNSGDAWASVGQEGQVFDEVAAELDGTGCLALVATTHGNDLWNTAETAPGAGKWKPWSQLATVPSALPPATSATLLPPTLTLDHDGRLQLFVVNPKTEGLYQVSAAEVDHWQPAVGRPLPHP